MKLYDGDEMEGEICPECVLAGPAGAAGKVRKRLEGVGRSEYESTKRRSEPSGSDF